MVREEDVAALVHHCMNCLDLNSVELDRDYGYDDLPSCVIDAVFSMGVTYTSTRNTVARFHSFFDIPQGEKSKNFSPDNRLSVREFLKFYDEYGVEGMTEQVYQNRQRTSTRNGILKSEAVLRFSEVLAQYGVEYLENVGKILGNPDFEQEIQMIPGQRSGISLRYFYMLAGSDDFIKPDRMIDRFVRQATGKSFTPDEATDLIRKSCSILAKTYPGLTPRTLDSEIWRYQRNQK